MSLARYAAVVLAILFVSLGVLSPLLRVRLSPPEQTSALFGAVLAAINALLAHGLLRWSEGRSTKVFLRAVLGGMAGRLALVLLAVLVAILGLGLPKLPLLISLLAYFVMFLALEMAVLAGGHRKAATGGAR